MIMGILRNGLNLMDVSSFWQQVLIGSIIVLAVYIDVLRRDIGTRNNLHVLVVFTLFRTVLINS